MLSIFLQRRGSGARKILRMGVIRQPRNIVIPTGASRSEQSSAPPTDDEGSVASGDVISSVVAKPVGF